MKSNKFVQDAQAQKNREILLKHNRKSLLSSRQPIKACGSDDDEVDASLPSEENLLRHNRTSCGSDDGEVDASLPSEEILLKHNRGSRVSSGLPIRACGSDDDDDGTSLPIENEYHEREKPPQQILDREKEIEELKKKILQLQQEQNQSHQPMMAIAVSEAAIQSVSSNLFPDHPEEPEENPEIQKEASDAKAIASPKNLRSHKLAMKKIKKVTIDMNRMVNQPEASTSSNASEIEKHKELQRKKDFQESRLPQANPSTSAPEESINQNVRESHESNTTDLQQKRPLSIADDNDNIGETGDGDDDGSPVSNIYRLPPKVKRIRTDNLNQIINKKSVKDIESALRYYGSNNENDVWGKKMYEVDGTKMNVENGYFHIYIGEGIKVSTPTWFLMKTKKPTIFVNDLILLLWGEGKLVNRCQDIGKVNTKLLDRSPVKELTPTKKRLVYKLYSDYLDGMKMKPSDKMAHLADVQKSSALKLVIFEKNTTSKPSSAWVSCVSKGIPFFTA